MKIILLLMSFFITSFCYSQNWKFLSEEKNGIYYYRPNTDETAWIKIVSDKMEYYPKKTSQKLATVDGYKILLYKFDCKSKKIGVIQATVYSKEGEVLDTYSENELLVEMNYVNPDSIGEYLLKTFCE
ncbi:MAG: surface-adhesin E family protein [Bacteroidia bacterium]